VRRPPGLRPPRPSSPRACGWPGFRPRRGRRCRGRTPGGCPTRRRSGRRSRRSPRHCRRRSAPPSMWPDAAVPAGP
jgi:hypothetical protein